MGSRIVVRQEPAPRQFEIIGIAEDVRDRAHQSSPPYQIYVAMPQAVFSSYPQGTIDRRLDYWFAIRTEAHSQDLAPTIRQAVREIDPGAPVDRVAPMRDAISEALGEWRSPMLLLATLAGIALVLSAIGVYGVVSSTVVQRRHEIGVRVALGASRARVLRLVVADAMVPCLAGVAAGLAGSYLATRYIAFMLYGVTPADPATFAWAVLMLLSVAVLACYIPARRAVHMDAMAALRCD
jgi:predicted lysophospholipase L1 biosynthesis ABC-type transport system permease subunit